MECSPGSRDLTCGGAGILIWIVPIVILTVTAGFGGWYATFTWPPLLVFMGVACLVNAKRCGRMHCFVTGPFFLLLALVSLLYGTGILPLGARGWQWLTDALLVGGCVLTCVPEWLFGKYMRRSAPKL
ncbi:MAG TPA: hypothetical protein VGT99_10890 [Gammaproteobacteria bacterium]|nr:hypothetical protein [Gammaproteobacteria bacterium]